MLKRLASIGAKRSSQLLPLREIDIWSLSIITIVVLDTFSGNCVVADTRRLCCCRSFDLSNQFKVCIENNAL